MSYVITFIVGAVCGILFHVIMAEPPPRLPDNRANGGWRGM